MVKTKRVSLGFKRLSLILLLTLIVSLVAYQQAIATEKKLVILTTSDLQSQVFPYVTKIKVEGKKVKIIAGGLARIAGIIKATKQEYPNSVLVISTGDDLMGPLFYNFHGEPEFKAMSKAGYDALALGNHEFDLGPDVLAEALQHAKFAVLSANLKTTDPKLKKHIKPYIIKEINGLKIGIFGLITPQLEMVANVGPNVKAEQDLIKIAKQMVKTLKEKGCDIIIAATHIGIDEDKNLAKHVEGISVICGGHTHILTKQPVIVEGPNGWKTVIVQAKSRGMYVGKLVLPITEDKKVDVKNVSWEPILVAEDKAVADLLKPYKQKLKEALQKPIGESLVDLDGRKKSVRSKESNLGDFIADALRWRFDGDIALTNGGGIRGDRIYPKGVITYETLYTIHPFGNTAVIVKLTGKEIKQILEISASALKGKNDKYNPNERTPTGGFLQVSGLRVTYDLNQPPTLIDNKGNLIKWGKRVKDVKVLENGKWVEIKDDKVYKVITNSWTANGGDKYFVFKQTKDKYDTTVNLVDVMADYIRHKGGKIAPKVEGRIVIIK